MTSKQKLYLRFGYLCIWQKDEYTVAWQRLDQGVNDLGMKSTHWLCTCTVYRMKKELPQNEWWIKKVEA